MASWGLAFQYGKKAYEDMWREQEENERLAASRKLFDMTLQEQEEALADETNTNREVRAGNQVITQYKKAIMQGGAEGAKALAEARTAMGIPTAYLGGTKVGTIGANGQVDKSTVIDMKGDKWNGTAMMAELYKLVPSARESFGLYNQNVAENRKLQAEFDLAAMKQNAMLRAAQIKAAGTRAGLASLGGSFAQAALANHWKDLVGMVDEQAVVTTFGPDAQIITDPNGVRVIMRPNKDGVMEAYNPTKEEWGDFQNIRNRALVNVNNGVYTGLSSIQGVVGSTADDQAAYQANILAQRAQAQQNALALDTLAREIVAQPKKEQAQQNALDWLTYRSRGGFGAF